MRSKIDLPAEETPTLGTVTDVEKLASQPFFSKAKNGDRVLIYSNAKKVVLYRPDEGRVIEIGNVNINNNTQGVTTTATNEPLKFAILNGTTTPEVITVIEEDLKKVLTDVNITSKVDAEVQTYEKTILVDLVGDENKAKEIADKLGIELSELPNGETKPEGVDFVIIVGKDKVAVNQP